MTKKIKKYLIWVSVPVLLLLGFAFFPAPQNTFSESEAEARLEVIIAERYLNSQSDLVTVEVENGFIDIIFEDTAICSEGNATFRMTKHINLRDFDTVSIRTFNAATRAAYYAPETPNGDDLRAAFFMVSVDMDQAARARVEVVSQRKDQIYNAAKEELGMGQEAGNRTYERFTQSTPELQTMSYEIREKCVDGIGIDLVRGRFSLPIRHENSVEYIKTINYLIRIYDE